MLVSLHLHVYFHPSTGWVNAKAQSYMCDYEDSTSAEPTHNHEKNIEIPVHDDAVATVRGLFAEELRRWQLLANTAQSL